MSMTSSGNANLAEKPEVRWVSVAGEQRAVATLRLFFDRLVPNPSKGPDEAKYIDSGGFWITGTVWGKDAERCAELLVKGSRVYVEGTQYLDKPYTNEKTGVISQSHRLAIERISLTLSRVANIGFKAKAAPAAPGAKPTKADEEEFFDGPDDSGVPDHAFG